MTEVSPEFDPATKTWFLADPEIEAPTLREVRDRLPQGYRLDPTYRLDGAPIVVRRPQERSTDAVQKYLSGFAAPKPTAERKPPTPPAPAPDAAKVIKRKSILEISAAAHLLAEQVADLYAATVPIKDIAARVNRSTRRVLKIIDCGRALGDPRFDVPRPRARPNTRKVCVVGQVMADGEVKVLSVVTEADAADAGLRS